MLLLSLFCLHYFDVDGNFGMKTNKVLDHWDALSDRGKLVVDIIISKGLDNIIFIAGDEDMKEMVKVSSLLQATGNIAITIMIIQYDEIEKEQYVWNEEASTVNDIGDTIAKEMKDFTYVILLYKDSYYSQFDDIETILRTFTQIRTSSNMLFIYKTYESVAEYQYYRFQHSFFSCKIFSFIYHQNKIGKLSTFTVSANFAALEKLPCSTAKL